jgi:hypothetical protein
MFLSYYYSSSSIGLLASVGRVSGLCHISMTGFVGRLPCRRDPSNESNFATQEVKIYSKRSWTLDKLARAPKWIDEKTFAHPTFLKHHGMCAAWNLISHILTLRVESNIFKLFIKITWRSLDSYAANQLFRSP